MNLKPQDLVKITKLTSLQIDYVTCMECCKYYIAPETAPCGHTLCHMCWRERLTCPNCAEPVDRRTLKHNQPVQKLKENVQVLADAFEKLFKIKVAEVLLDVESEDPTKNVKEWLASSQNHFSAPTHSSQKLSQDTIEFPKTLVVSSNKIQIHPNTTKHEIPKPGKAVYVSKIPQDDWDKIETLPDSEDIGKKGKENVIGPMDIEPFYIDDENQYTADNPRRSSRKRDWKTSNDNSTDDKVLKKRNSKDSNEDIDKIASTAKQNWNNVKRMRKEFSKLNKKNRNKLNVSIEMCKKTPSVTKTLDDIPLPTSAHYDINENTPLQTKELPETNKMSVHEKEKIESVQKFHTSTNNSSTNINNQSSQLNSRQASSKCNGSNSKIDVTQKSDVHKIHSSKDESSNAQPSQKNIAKMPFYKKSALGPAPTETKVSDTINHTVESNTRSNDDIEITIKVGNTVANILIKKQNDMALRLNTDREVQTSLGLHAIDKKTSMPQSQAQNIVINLGKNYDIAVAHHSITGPRVDELKEGGSGITVSEKKHTDSDDTATAQYEITASIEKELSKQMEVGEINEPERTKTITIPTEKSNKINESEKTSNEKVGENQKPVEETKKGDKTCAQSQNAPSSVDVDEYINDVDIFDSEQTKEQQVQYLKNTEPAMSEILISTEKSRSKTQKSNEIRCRNANDKDVLPKSRKDKCDDTNITANITAEKDVSAQNHPDSEPINYDAIMGTVFANIDAEIGESQNVIKNTYTLEEKTSQNYNIQEPTQVKMTQEVDLPCDENIKALNKCNLKDSEILFTASEEKNDSEVTVHLASLAEKMPENVHNPDLVEFLTPVMSHPVDNDVPMANDDSDDKSIVEDTPQKSSFTKVKKSNGANKTNKNVTQTEELPIQKQPSKPATEDMNSIISITDTSVKSVANETTIRKAPTETPLSIDKFVNQIQHKSTPFAKKSLNFDTQNDDLTICATTEGVVNTTQEREFMLRAFEKTPTTVVKPTVRSLVLQHKKYVIAGSCLTNKENEILKRLCARNNWIYQHEYTNELTHLVVKVVKENRAQRTIKFMCALAASKWIVSYKWVAKCLQSKEPVNEEQFEVLDSTGHPGPMRSRLATNKLFQGIKFFCMEPFESLDVNTLKEMLTSAGGNVVDQVKAVRLVDDTATPALLLAEPENTQENKFIYLALEQTLVPVNYEWAINCLGSYCLHSIQDLLLCPSSLLPKAIQKWPQELVAQCDDDDE